MCGEGVKGVWGRGTTLLRLAVHVIRLCILLCSTVVLIEVSSFKLCTDVIDRAVCVCAILKGLLCCTLPGHFQVSAL